MIFIDEFFKFYYTNLLKIKDIIFTKFKIYMTEVKNQLDRKNKILKSNRGGEYIYNKFIKFCEDHSIIHKVPFLL